MGDLLAPLDDVEGVLWSAAVADPASGRILDVRDAGRVLPTASIGKVLLLLEVAARLVDGRLDPRSALARTDDDAVGDSGLWQHLRVDALPAQDLAVLVGSVSDNLATNVLLRHVGLAAVDARAAALGLASTRLLDRVRDVRTAADAPHLSESHALDLVRLASLLATEDATEWALVRQWLATGTDLSLVAGDLGLDPLAHLDLDRGVRLLSKTGSDHGVRADMGLLASADRVTSYAVVARWEPGGADDPVRDAVVRAMRAVGRRLAHGD